MDVTEDTLPYAPFAEALRRPRRRARAARGHGAPLSATAQGRMYERLVERYPTLTALFEADAFAARAEAFEFGLQRVLDGLEAYLAGETRTESG